MVEVDIKIVPCDFQRFENDIVGEFYEVRLYQLIDSKSLVTYSFWRLADCEFNFTEMVSQGYHPEIHVTKVHVTPCSFKDMYLQIKEYELYVSQSNTD